MKTILKIFGSSAFISFLIILPFIIMEVVNRRSFNEEFPGMLFLVMWLNLFAFSLILMPIVQGMRIGNHDTADAVPARGKTILTNPKWAALISVVLLLSPGILVLLESLGWLSLQTLFNGPDSEQPYLPGQLMALASFSIPAAAGIIAGRPIVSTRQAGGSLFAHPINLIIVALILSAIAFGLGSLIIDQWPCFMGVPMCD